MSLTVGNLLADPAAQSFISHADADAYLAPEQAEAWDLARPDQREAALVRASRWLATAFTFAPLTEAGVVRLGHVAARLAAETIGKPLFEGVEIGSVVTSERVGSISVTYATGIRADAAGVMWPWLRPMLSGLIVSSALRPVVRA